MKFASLSALAWSVCLLFILLCASASSLAEIVFSDEEQAFIKANPVLHFSAIENIYPYVMRGRDNKLVGISTDFFKRVEKATGLTIQLHEIPTASLTDWQLGDIKMNGSVALTSIYGKASGHHMTKNYSKEQAYLVVKRGNPSRIMSIRDLEDKRGTFVSTYYYQRKLVEGMSKKEPVIADNALGALRLLASGEADFTVTTRAAVLSAKQQGLDIFDLAFPLGEALDVVAIIHKDYPVLRGIFNKVIERYSEEERLADRNKWFSRIGEFSNFLKLTAAELDFISRQKELKVGLDPLLIKSLAKARNDGELVGITREYMDEIERRSGLKLTPVFGQWATMPGKIKSGEIDVMANINTNAYSDIVTMTDSYIALKPLVFVAKGNPKGIKKVSDLAGKRMAVVKGSSLAAKFAKANGISEIVNYEDETGMINSLIRGEADFFLSTQGTFNFAVEKGFDFFEIAFALNMDAIFYFGVKNGLDEAVSIFNKVFASISENEHKDIVNRWMKPIQDAREVIELTPQEKAFIRDNPEVVVGATPDIPPFVVSENGDGLNSDIFALVKKKTGLAISQEMTGWADAIELAELGYVDGVANVIASSNWNDSFLLSHVYMDLYPAVFVKAGNPKGIHSIEDLKGKRIGSLSGLKFVKDFAKSIGIQEENIVYFETTRELIEGLSFGDLDFTISTAGLLHYANRVGLNYVEVAFPFETPAFFSFAFNKDKPELRSIVNKVLASISDNELYELQGKW